VSEGGWTPKPWDDAPDRPARLPRIGDLPSVDGGYQGAAVESAFAAFHDHAARLDRTLEVLEAVAAFEQQAGALRTDIRALRAAAWGPLPVPRSSWGAAYATRSAARSAAVPAALPRLAVEAAFIVLVAVGAGLAEVDTPVLVALVLGAWLIVGLVEVLVASTRSQRRVGTPTPMAAGPLFVAPPRRRIVLEDTQEEVVVFEPAPELEAALEYEPELAADEEDEYDDDEVELEDEPENELDDAPEERDEAEVADPWAHEEEEGSPPEPVAEEEDDRDADTDEQPALVSLVPEPDPGHQPESEPEPERGRGRFWRRKPEPSSAGDAEAVEGPGHAVEEPDTFVPARSSAFRRGRR
jgi:hypothetical protein